MTCKVIIRLSAAKLIHNYGWARGFMKRNEFSAYVCTLTISRYRQREIYHRSLHIECHIARTDGAT
jgi:hypothetical protein